MQSSVSELAEQLELLQSDDEDFMKKVIHDVLAKSPNEVSRFRKGEKKLMGFFIGQVMKLSKGKISASKAGAYITKYLLEE